jgi:hypothetical protein
VFFAAVAGTTEGLEIAEVVAAAAGEGNDVIDRQFSGLATALTLVIIALKNVFPNCFGNVDPLGFFWHGEYLVLFDRQTIRQLSDLI